MKKNLIVPLAISSVIVAIYGLIYRFTALLPEGNTIIWGYSDISFLNFPDKSLLPSISFFWQVSIIFLSVFFTLRVLKFITIKIDKKLIKESVETILVSLFWTAGVLIGPYIRYEGLALLIYGVMLSVVIPIVSGVMELATHGDEKFRQHSYSNAVFPISFFACVFTSIFIFWLRFSLNLTFLFFINFLYFFILYRLFCLLNKNGKLIISDDINLTVNYNQSLERMIADGKYYWINKKITEKEFPLPPELTDKKREISAKLISFEPDISIDWYSSEYVLSKIIGLGYRPAIFPELLALGSQYPNLQMKHSITALGSFSQEIEGHRWAPELYSDGNDISERVLSLIWGDGKFECERQFLVVSQHKSKLFHRLLNFFNT